MYELSLTFSFILLICLPCKVITMQVRQCYAGLSCTGGWACAVRSAKSQWVRKDGYLHTTLISSSGVKKNETNLIKCNICMCVHVPVCEHVVGSESDRKTAPVCHCLCVPLHQSMLWLP